MFTLIICSYNGEQRLAKAVEGVLGQEGYASRVARLVLVDNNSTDGTEAVMRAYAKSRPEAVYVKETAQGLAYARLAGLRHVETEWLVYLDDDNIMAPTWLTEAAGFIASHPRLGALNGAVIPRLDFTPGSLQTALLRRYYKYLTCTHLARRDIDPARTRHPLGWMFGAGLLLRAEPVKELAREGWLRNVGRRGADLYCGDDVELCAYVKRRGYELLYHPGMVMEHLIGPERLTRDYLSRLYAGYVESCYEEMVRGKSEYLVHWLARLGLYGQALAARLGKNGGFGTIAAVEASFYRAFLAHYEKKKAQRR
ncbi:MAG: glycosyltransferase [Patescibacteria group bacterium]